ncbi:YggS family pyridoxal phosphate enzyme [Verruconis gallopava]|uniref:Pyridoxal phosphate homeostasis protein n=1 Tax=Verruconis gallopava TaxID=253628 RepID=A0A0D1Y0F4_9PEZI|nr:YggS family pyridoxal phosphate enzyme [Verruconis gallopava]KIW08501.1 YggS family pyridoxal phosphate enzyme [Verruconis gallopava]
MAEMPSAARVQTLLSNLSSVTNRIASLSTQHPVRLILVSKLKPASDVLALHSSDARPSHFGENYVQELLEKAELLPRSIKWHFIGGLQSNKCKILAERVPNLWCVSSVDSVKKANELEKGRKALMEKDESADRLRVMVQVNTSGEESKSGVEPKEALGLCRHIRDSCPHLKLSGLMTIGAIARSQETTVENENEDFEVLRAVRDEVAKGLGIDPSELELSMGMSSDYEGAIKQGSNEVRIGSSIFGERPPKNEAKVTGEAG